MALDDSESEEDEEGVEEIEEEGTDMESDLDTKSNEGKHDLFIYLKAYFYCGAYLLKCFFFLVILRSS